MLVDINRVTVGDRIRKDFGDIEELAEDIRQNGLINPPTVTPDYRLIAGERRLRALKLLGKTEIEVRVINPEDAAHELRMEISENECRKEFSHTERLRVYELLVDAIRKGDIYALGRSPKESAAKMVGAKTHTLAKDKRILANADQFTDEEISEWDSGNDSTAAMIRKLEERLAEQERKTTEYESRLNEAKQRNASLVQQLSERPVEKVVERVEVPSQEDKEHIRRLQSETQLLAKENRGLFAKSEEYRKEAKAREEEVERLRKQTTEERQNIDLKSNCILFCAACQNFMANVGGYAYLAGELANLPERERKGYADAVSMIYAWAQNILANVEEVKGIV